MDLIIVESPTKATTFKKFLKSDKFNIQATLGHVRDLPENKIAVDLDNKFKPEYLILPKRKLLIDEIRVLAKDAHWVILATDSDREGEAIAYHLAYLLGFIKENWPDSSLKKTQKLKRIVFHEITKEVIENSLKQPKILNLNLVNAQQARRILDRIVGYKLSPLLWKKIGKKWLSAGRVQTVALRFIVEREKEIKNFQSEVYYKGEGLFYINTHDEIKAILISKDGENYEKKITLNLFDGEYTYTKTSIEKVQLENLKKDLLSDNYKIEEIKTFLIKRYPPPPFITSSLQQESSRLFGYSAKYTMRLAQNLYEKGLITYHRTDSFFLSSKFLFQAKKYIEKIFGDKYIVKEPRRYKSKSKLAQEAHEAIRPTNVFSKIEKTERLSNPHKKLYDLILKRALATQMAEAEFKKTAIKILGSKGYLFKSEWEIIIFEGHLKIYNKKIAKEDFFLPEKNQPVSLKELKFIEKITAPPSRYNEAMLIKTLEEKGIGRPSTYAPIISTIQGRNYVEKKEGRFFPTFLGTVISDYLSAAFPNIFDIYFTAAMEEKLDFIAQGKKQMVEILKDFYQPLKENLKKQQKINGYINIEEKTDEKCPQCNHNLVFRYSRYGKFYACSNFPKCKFTKPYFEKIDKKCPKCGGDIIIKYTKRKKRFYGCSNYPKCNFAAWRVNQIG
jgi:DNA topoisomerase-1